MSLLPHTCRRIAVWMLTSRADFNRFDGARLQLERATCSNWNEPLQTPWSAITTPIKRIYDLLRRARLALWEQKRLSFLMNYQLILVSKLLLVFQTLLLHIDMINFLLVVVPVSS